MLHLRERGDHVDLHFSSSSQSNLVTSCVRRIPTNWRMDAGNGEEAQREVGLYSFSTFCQPREKRISRQVCDVSDQSGGFPSQSSEIDFLMQVIFLLCLVYAYVYHVFITFLAPAARATYTPRSPGGVRLVSSSRSQYWVIIITHHVRT